MQNVVVEIIDSLTFEVIDSVDMSIDNLKKITVITSDPETTKVNIVTKED